MSNGLRLNLGEFKVLIKDSRAFMGRIDLRALAPILVDDTILPFVGEACNMGMSMTPSWSWWSYVVSVSRRHRYSPQVGVLQ